MKLYILFVLGFLVMGCNGPKNLSSKSNQPQESNEQEYLPLIPAEYIEANPDLFEGKIDEAPAYPKGNQGISEAIRANFYYPSEARDNGIQGKVYVSFVIGVDGKVKDIEIARGVHETLDQVAIHCIRQLKTFKPGKLNGESVEFTYTIPISFKLAGH